MLVATGQESRPEFADSQAGKIEGKELVGPNQLGSSQLNGYN